VTHVLRGIDITIKENEFVAVMGKSGAGKSTLMYQLSALDHPTEGEIIVDGTNIIDLSERDLTLFRLYTLGYIFQDYALVPDLNALENVILSLLMRGDDWNQAEKVARMTLDSVGLEGKYRNLPSELSGGEQQRVSVARAIVGKPKILFADEPTANLDSISGGSVIDLLGKLHKEGQTIVMVTHEREYTKYCDRVIEIEDGRITAQKKPDGTPIEIEECVEDGINPCYKALERAKKEKEADTPAH
jgi:putative ABC transport system ATP-binding protein